MSQSNTQVASAAAPAPKKVPGGIASMTLANVVEKLCCAREGYYK